LTCSTLPGQAGRTTDASARQSPTNRAGR
jgi:hypothetical protein